MNSSNVRAGRPRDRAVDSIGSADEHRCRCRLRCL